MEYLYLKKVEMQFFITVCYLIGTSLSVSLFGIDSPVPERGVNTGFEPLSQSLRLNENQQKPNDPFSAISPFSYMDNFYQPKFFNPTPVDFVENVKLKPALPSEFTNQLTPDNRKASTDAPVKFGCRGSFNSKEEYSKSTESPNQKSKEVSASYYTLGWSEIGTDYTTETSQYDETTTDEDFNRIGGPAPAVVASLLG